MATSPALSEAATLREAFAFRKVAGCGFLRNRATTEAGSNETQNPIDSLFHKMTTLRTIG